MGWGSNRRCDRGSDGGCVSDGCGDRVHTGDRGGASVRGRRRRPRRESRFNRRSDARRLRKRGRLVCARAHDPPLLPQLLRGARRPKPLGDVVPFSGPFRHHEITQPVLFQLGPFCRGARSADHQGRTAGRTAAPITPAARPSHAAAAGADAASAAVGATFTATSTTRGAGIRPPRGGSTSNRLEGRRSADGRRFRGTGWGLPDWLSRGQSMDLCTIGQGPGARRSRLRHGRRRLVRLAVGVQCEDRCHASGQASSVGLLAQAPLWRRSRGPNIALAFCFHPIAGRYQ